jgi:endo-1,4-beta-xylanase
MNDPIIGEEWKQLDEASRGYDPVAIAPDLDAARARIRRIRMSDVVLRAVGDDGRPLAGLRLDIEQQRSAFPWGDQQWELSTLHRYGQGASDRVRHYTHRYTDCLNAANCLSYWSERPQNDGPKHQEFQGEDRLDDFAWQVDWARANGLVAKGHPIFWPVPKGIPDWVKRYPYETQLVFLEARVRNLVACFRGKVAIWDVVNEPMWEPALRNLGTRHWPHMEDLDAILGYVEPVMRWARDEDPDACYVINDYGMEVDAPGRELRAADGSLVTAKRQRDRFKALFRALHERGCPADGLCMQSHTGGWITPAEQNAILDDFAEAGVPLHYTEFWASTGHLDKAGLDPRTVARMKAEYVANLITVAYAHPAVAAFFFWGGITNEMGFRNDHNSGGLPTSSHQPTPTYERVRHLLREEWWTRETVVTDADGVARLRAFHCDHSARYALAGGGRAGVGFTVTPQRGGPIELRCHRPA